MKQVETLILQFNTKLKQREISLFRGKNRKKNKIKKAKDKGQV